jgi:hypothetical protein
LAVDETAAEIRLPPECGTRKGILKETLLPPVPEVKLHMTDRELPPWAVRLRQERVRRLWSQKTTAVRLRDAADEQTRASLPAVESIQR